MYDALLLRGPLYGYFMQPKKCILVVKEGREEAVAMSSGTRHLGAVLGSPADKLKFVDEKVKNWIQEIEILSYAAFTHCLQAKWNFLSRTLPGVGALLIDVEEAIRQKFIPSLIKSEISDDLRKLLALPHASLDWASSTHAKDRSSTSNTQPNYVHHLFPSFSDKRTTLNLIPCARIKN